MPSSMPEEAREDWLLELEHTGAVQPMPSTAQARGRISLATGAKVRHDIIFLQELHGSRAEME